MRKLEAFRHRYHLFRNLKWGRARGEKDLHPLPQGENGRPLSGGPVAAYIAGCATPATPAGDTTSRLRTVRGGGPGVAH